MSILKQAIKLLGKNADEVVQGPLLPKTGKYFAKPPLVSQIKDGKLNRRKVLDPVQHQSNQIEYLSTKGNRKAGDVNFIDEKGEAHYMNKKNDGYQYSNLNVIAKNNEQLSKRRKANIEDQTKYPDSHFKKGAPAGTDAHHIAGLEQWSWVYEGLNRGDKMTLTAYLEEMGIPMGDNPMNRADLSPKVHDQLHTWMRSKGFLGRKKKALGNMPLEDRMEFVQQVIKEYKESLKKMFDLQMAEKHGEVWISPDQLNRSIQRLNQPELAVYDRS